MYSNKTKYCLTTSKSILQSIINQDRYHGFPVYPQTLPSWTWCALSTSPLWRKLFILPVWKSRGEIFHYLIPVCLGNSISPPRNKIIYSLRQSLSQIKSFTCQSISRQAYGLFSCSHVQSSKTSSFTGWYLWPLWLLSPLQLSLPLSGPPPLLVICCCLIYYTKIDVIKSISVHYFTVSLGQES